MTPLLTGVFASQISGHLYTMTGSYDSLGTVTVPSGGLASVTFAGIPTGYTHLQIRYIARATTSDNTIMTFNGDTATNYATHYLLGNGSAASAGNAAPNNTFIYTDILTGSTTSYAGTIVDILDYASINKNKTARSLSGIDLNGSGTMWLASGAWFNSSTAINSITLKPANYSFQQYSSFALYGVK